MTKGQGKVFVLAGALARYGCNELAEQRGALVKALHLDRETMVTLGGLGEFPRGRRDRDGAAVSGCCCGSDVEEGAGLAVVCGDRAGASLRGVCGVWVRGIAERGDVERADSSFAGDDGGQGEADHDGHEVSESRENCFGRTRRVRTTMAASPRGWGGRFRVF